MKLSLSTATSSQPGLPLFCRTVADPSDMTGSDLSANTKFLNARWQCQSQIANSLLSLVIGGDFGRGLASPTSQCSSGLVVAEMVVCAWGGLEYACITVIKYILELVTENSGRGKGVVLWRKSLTT